MCSITTYDTIWSAVSSLLSFPVLLIIPCKVSKLPLVLSNTVSCVLYGMDPTSMPCHCLILCSISSYLVWYCRAPTSDVCRCIVHDWGGHNLCVVVCYVRKHDWNHRALSLAVRRRLSYSASFFLPPLTAGQHFTLLFLSSLQQANISLCLSLTYFHPIARSPSVSVSSAECQRTCAWPQTPPLKSVLTSHRTSTLPCMMTSKEEWLPQMKTL